MTGIKKIKIIKDQREIQKRIAVVPGNRTYADTTSYDKKILFIGDSHIKRVKRHRLNNSFKQGKYLMKFFIGTKIQDLEHYVTTRL